MDDKRPFIKHFWWLIPVFVIIIVVALIAPGILKDIRDKQQPPEDEKITGTIVPPDTSDEGITQGTGDKGEKAQPFTAGQLAAAEIALANGVVIEDPQNDWYKIIPGPVTPGDRPENPNAYPLPYTDLRSVSFGADDKYIYFKFRFWGDLPISSVMYEGDLLWSIGCWADMEFTNSEGVRDKALAGPGITLANFQNSVITTTEKTFIDQLAWISPTGERDFMDEMLYERVTGAGMIGGGGGTDYLLSAFRLDIFPLKPGDELYFSFDTETSSETYHHVCLDYILGAEGCKDGTTLGYVIGSNNYTVIKPPDPFILK
jgi:hypothetical protein